MGLSKGVALEEPDIEWVARMERWGLNFVSVKAGPENTLSPEGKSKAVNLGLHSFLQAAQEKKLGVAVRLAPHQGVNLIQDEDRLRSKLLRPEDDIINLAYKDIWTYANQHLLAMTDLLNCADASQKRLTLDITKMNHTVRNGRNLPEPLTLEKNGFFETEIGRTQEEFGPVVHLFSTYQSKRTLDDPEPFARGINSFQLMNDGERWWVLTIYWTSEGPDLPIPEKYIR